MEERDQENWATPQIVFDALNEEFNFILDACADHENHKCDIYFTKEDNALLRDWYPYKRIWCNPPYDTRENHSNLLIWAGKAHSEAQKSCIVVCLLPSKTDTLWWHTYAKDAEQRFIKGRLHFNDHKNRAPFPSVVLVFSTWRILVERFLQMAGGKASIKDLYAIIQKNISVHRNSHIRAKIRQTLQRYENFHRVERGVWAIS